ncbi:MAG: glycosyltransferase [Candidatus Diapherotrites archaeon]|nr:glycosyltransferase [Candidatus Diapherotrites archaeon]
MASKRIKISFFLYDLYSGGAERFVQVLANNLDKKKFDVTIVALVSGKHYPLDVGVKFLRLNVGFKFFCLKFFLKLYSICLKFVNDLRAVFCYTNSKKAAYPAYLSFGFFFHIRSLIDFFGRDKPDIVFSLLPLPNFLAVFSSPFFGYKSIVSERAFSPLEPDSEPAIIRKLYPVADAIITNSKETANALVSVYGLPSAKVFTIYNPVDIGAVLKAGKEKVDRSRVSAHNPPIIVACGRLVPQKGFDILLDAFCLVRRHVDCRLVIVGEGPELAALLALSERFGVRDFVDFVGWQSNPWKFFSKADVFVLSSRYEGLPNVVLEAMALGIPVVSADCKSGPKEIISHGRNGLLVPVGNPDAMAKAVVRVLSDKRLHRRLSANAKKRAKDFDVPLVVRQFEEFFERMVK